VIRKILPSAVSVVEVFQDIPGITLFAEEAAVIAKAAEKRRREFTTARACARAALARLGVPPVPIVPGTGGAPRWPDGIVGSITHCAGYRASAVAWQADILTLGLDAEPNEALPDRVLDLVSVAEERARLAELSAVSPGVRWDRLLFSLKETVYKAWFPITGSWLGFQDAVVAIDRSGTFTARLPVPCGTIGGQELNGFKGRWLASNGLILSAIAMPVR
jgi:4'-phosphopantetheinyl transferase EntD